VYLVFSIAVSALSRVYSRSRPKIAEVAADAFGGAAASAVKAQKAKRQIASRLAFGFRDIGFRDKYCTDFSYIVVGSLYCNCFFNTSGLFVKKAADAL